MGKSGCRILVAEDTSVLAIILGRTFGGAGFDVTIAKDGQEAWEHAQKTRFDAIVTDQQMPEMSGSELCERLRKIDHYAEIPIIMVTAKAYELDPNHLRNDLHVAEIFVKPFSPKQVLESLEEYLSSSPG